MLCLWRATGCGTIRDESGRPGRDVMAEKKKSQRSGFPIFMCTSENFHPYECDGPGKCGHCDKVKNDRHNPEKCALCKDA